MHLGIMMMLWVYSSGMENYLHYLQLMFEGLRETSLKLKKVGATFESTFSIFGIFSIRTGYTTFTRKGRKCKRIATLRNPREIK